MRQYRAASETMSVFMWRLAQPNQMEWKDASPGSAILSANDAICLTEGQHRTLCVSSQLPVCLRPPDVWSIDHFDLITELYHGKISLLHQAVHKASGMLVAIKQYKKKHLTALAKYQIEREVRIHISLQHHHIIKLMAVFEDPDVVYLVQEFAPGGDLFEALKHQSSMVYGELEAVGRYMEPCLQALEYIHERRIIHRDIKPENILLGEGGAVKLADFGLAIDQEQERPVTRAGTLDYMAPEVLVCPDKRRPEENKDKASLGYDEQVDTWALGCLAAELITGSPPFESESRSATYQLIMYREPKLPARLSEEAKSFITACLNKSAKERSTVQQLLQHEWITSNVRAFRQQTAAREAPVQQAVAVSGPATACNGAAGVAMAIRKVGSTSCSSSPLLCQQPGDRYITCSSNRSRAWDSSNADCSAAAAGPSPAPSIETVVTPAAADWGVGLQQVLTASSAGAAAMAAEAAQLGDYMQGVPIAGGATERLLAAGAQAASPTVQADRPLANSQANLQYNGQLELPRASMAVGSAVAAVDAIALAGAAAEPLLLASEVVSMAPQAAQPAATASSAALCTPVAAPAAVNCADFTVNGVSSSSCSAAKARLARASSHRGHRLHKLFYPHDRHRRSSYNNCNTQWDDFIDTSAHSLTSNTGAVVQPDSILGAAGERAAAGVTSMMVASRGTSFCHGVALLQQGLGNSSGHLTSSASDIVDSVNGLYTGRHVDTFTASSSANSSVAARGSVVHQAVFAALPDAGLQAPAAVVEQVISTVASGALHLLAATDLEDLIALNPAPGNALISLGVAGPLALQSVSAHSGMPPHSTHNSSNFAAANGATATYGDGAGRMVQESSVAGAVLGALTGSNLDDFIATTASPGGRTVNRVGVLVSRSSSAANLSALAVSMPHSLPLSAKTAACRPPDAPAGSYCTLKSRAPKTDRASPAPVTSPRVVEVGTGSCTAAPAAYEAASSRALSVMSKLPAKSGTFGVLAIPSRDAGPAVTADVCPPGVGLQHAPCSEPAGYQPDRASTPTGTSKKSVVWADGTTAPPCVHSTPKAAVSSRPAAPAAALDSGMCAGSAAMCERDSNTCLSPRLQQAWLGALEQHEGSTGSTVKQTSGQPSPVQLHLQQQQWKGVSPPGANYYYPPTGVLSNDAGLVCPATGSLTSIAAPAPVSGYSSNRSNSCLPADLRAPAAGTMGQVQGTVVAGNAGVGSTCISKTVRRLSGSGGTTATAALGSSAGACNAAVSLAAVGALTKGFTNLFQPQRCSSNQHECTQTVTVPWDSSRRSSSTDAEASGTSAYRRCRGSSSGADDCAGTVLRQPAKSFACAFQNASLTRDGIIAAAGGGRLKMRCRRSSSDAECELLDAIAARQQCRSFTAGMGMNSALQDAGGSSAAGSRGRGPLAPTKVWACVPGWQSDPQKLRSKSLTGAAAAAAWP